MALTAAAIPEKIFFKIGEVCDIVGVEAHVLRYWETEFAQLSPQKNRSGQRAYRRRDVEIALRIKELLYDDLYTIAGAKKKLASEMRETPKLKVVPNDQFRAEEPRPAISSFEQSFDSDEEFDSDFEDEPQEISHDLSADNRDALRGLTTQLLELKQILSKTTVSTPRRRW